MVMAFCDQLIMDRAEDIYIFSNSSFGLRNGDKVAGKARPPKESERYYGLMHVESVNGKDPEEGKSGHIFQR